MRWLRSVIALGLALALGLEQAVRHGRFHAFALWAYICRGAAGRARSFAIHQAFHHAHQVIAHIVGTLFILFF